jgi:hypothetical protein
MIVGMKRVLALALIGGALLLGGCGRQQAAAHPAGVSPATASPAATSSAVSGTSAASVAKSDKSDSSDVDSLLSDVDKQLNSDDQPPADQD